MAPTDRLINEERDIWRNLETSQKLNLSQNSQSLVCKRKYASGMKSLPGVTFKKRDKEFKFCSSDISARHNSQAKLVSSRQR